MRVLVIYCDPTETSFASVLHRTVLQALRSRGHEIMDLDLYAEAFDLRCRARNGRNMRYHDTVARYASQLAQAEAVVAVYPTWWYGLPAMLKGYFDRVWAPGIAFDVERWRSGLLVSGGSILLGAVAARTAENEIACRMCPRHGNLHTERLMQEHGPEMPILRLPILFTGRHPIAHKIPLGLGAFDGARAFRLHCREIGQWRGALNIHRRICSESLSAPKVAT
jgi:putative NADPH-quinone reductase